MERLDEDLLSPKKHIYIYIYIYSKGEGRQQKRKTMLGTNQDCFRRTKIFAK